MTLSEVIKQTQPQLGEIEIPGATRNDLARWFSELGFRFGAEIGVECGKYSKVLLASNPDLTLLCIDAWAAYQGYREHVPQEKVDTFLVQTKERLAEFGNRAKIIKGWSTEVAKDIPDGSLDFIYIDGNHSLVHTIADLAAWIPKVRHGGFIAGHDYRLGKGTDEPCHVPYAIQAWTLAYNVPYWYVLKGERSASWFWEKP